MVVILVNRALEPLVAALFPNHCSLCGLRSHRALPLCRACQQDLPVNRQCCYRCALPLAAATGEDPVPVCGKCQQHPPPYHRVLAPWLYDEHLSLLIHRWKYRRQRHLTALLGYLWLQQVALPGPVDVLIPVPLHWRKLLRRGFNQADLLARELHRSHPLVNRATLAQRAVRRRRHTAAQSGISAAARAGNLAGAFTSRRPCDNLRIAIVDDVITTGATAAAMADVLREAGASRIEVWCIARTPAPDG